MGRPPGIKNKVLNAKNDEVLASVSGLTLNGVSNKLASTQVEISKTLGDLSAKLSEQLSVLDNVKAAIVIENDKLKTLYAIEATAQTLDDINMSIENTRAAWIKENEERERRETELATEREKIRLRAEEEYAYTTAQRHKKEEDAFRTSMLIADKEFKEKQAAVEKSWNDNWIKREAALKDREVRITELENIANGVPERIKAEVDKAVAIATNSLKKDYETKIVLQAKDSESEKKLAAQEIASLNTTILKLTNQMIELQKSLAQAHSDVKDISAKALDSASNRAVADALKDAMSQRDSNGKPSK